MSMYPIQGDPAGLRQMTAEQFRYLGLTALVYLKADQLDGERAIAIYGADGTQLWIVDTLETAAEHLNEHGVGFVSIH